MCFCRGGALGDGICTNSIAMRLATRSIVNGVVSVGEGVSFIAILALSVFWSLRGFRGQNLYEHYWREIGNTLSYEVHFSRNSLNHAN